MGNVYQIVQLTISQMNMATVSNVMPNASNAPEPQHSVLHVIQE